MKKEKVEIMWHDGRRIRTKEQIVRDIKKDVRNMVKQWNKCKPLTTDGKLRITLKESYMIYIILGLRS